MTKDDDVNLDEERLFYLGTGLIYKCVCAPKSWDGERVSAEATKADPPGTSGNKWVVSDGSTLNEPQDNPQPCRDCENRQHWILNC